MTVQNLKRPAVYEAKNKCGTLIYYKESRFNFVIRCLFHVYVSYGMGKYVDENGDEKYNVDVYVEHLCPECLVECCLVQTWHVFVFRTM